MPNLSIRTKIIGEEAERLAKITTRLEVLEMATNAIVFSGDNGFYKKIDKICDIFESQNKKIQNAILYLLLTSKEFEDTEKLLSYERCFEGKIPDGNGGYIKGNGLNMYSGFDGLEYVLNDRSTILEYKVGVKDSQSMAEAGATLTGDYYSLGLAASLSKAEYDAYIAAGAYVTEDGELAFGVIASAEASYSVAEIGADVEIGSDKLGMYGSANMAVGTVSAAAEFMLSTQGVSFKAEAGAYLAEVGVEAGIKVADIDVKVEASMTVGIGAEFEFEYADGVITFDFGVALGLGVDLGFSIDAGVVIDKAEAVAEQFGAYWLDGAEIIGEAFEQCSEWHEEGVEILLEEAERFGEMTKSGWKIIKNLFS